MGKHWLLLSIRKSKSIFCVSWIAIHWLWLQLSNNVVEVSDWTTEKKVKHAQIFLLIEFQILLNLHLAPFFLIHLITAYFKVLIPIPFSRSMDMKNILNFPFYQIGYKNFDLSIYKMDAFRVSTSSSQSGYFFQSNKSCPINSDDIVSILEKFQWKIVKKKFHFEKFFCWALFSYFGIFFRIMLSILMKISHHKTSKRKKKLIHHGKTSTDTRCLMHDPSKNKSCEAFPHWGIGFVIGIR